MNVLTIVTESVTLAAIYLMIGLAWVIIYRATRVLNFATGQMLLIGALVYFSLTSAGLPMLVALVVAAVINAGVAMLTYDLLLKPLAGRPVFSQIIVTVGLSIVLATMITIIWGTDSRSLESPFSDRKVYRIGDAVLTNMDLAIVGVALAVFLSLLAFLQWSRPGRQMRGAAEAPLLASQSGININHVFRLSWAIAGVAMAVGGIGFAFLTIITPSLIDLGLRGIAPALIAGLDDIRGLIVGAVAIAVLENLAAYYFGGDVRNVVPFIVILLVLVIRPYGLFGSPEIRRV